MEVVAVWLERVRRGTAVVAVLISLGVMANLAAANVSYYKKVRSTQILASIVPASGALQGKRAGVASEWAPSDSDAGLIFGISEPGSAGDLVFWRDVASRMAEISPTVLAAGLCLSERACEDATEGSPLVTLSAMDPAQVHALGVAARQRRVFIFYSSRVIGTVPFPTDASQLTEFIVAVSAMVSDRTRRGNDDVAR